MQRTECRAIIMAIFAVMTATPILADSAAASCSKVIHAFVWLKHPMGNLVRDAAGNLYGTTFEGAGTGCGGSGCGAVWKLVPSPDGTWMGSTLYVFKGPDGANPAAGLIFDAAGNLYGTTSAGGTSTACGPGGCGVVFKLTPNTDGTWSESVLHNFIGADGGEPQAGLIFDAAGSLYGTAQSFGPTYNCGVAFKLTQSPDGTWTESVLHNFSCGPDGGDSDAGVVFDAAGNLYGTTINGGAYGAGVVFKLAPNPDETWTESVLYSFSYGLGGSFPYHATLIIDAAGNLYGTTPSGGGSSCTAPGFGSGCGVVFKLAPNLDGIWTESVLHTFIGGAEGAVPDAGVVFDAAGNLYGTTLYGGADFGVVFKLTSSGWSETVLHTFFGYGRNPDAPVLFDPAGNLYGTASNGGEPPYGLVLEITP